MFDVHRVNRCRVQETAAGGIKVSLVKSYLVGLLKTIGNRPKASCELISALSWIGDNLVLSLCENQSKTS